MPGRRRIASLAVIMLGVASLAITAVVMVLYAASVTAQLKLMEAFVTNRASMLEPVLTAVGAGGGGRIDDAVRLLRHPELTFSGFGESGEWVLVEGDYERPRFRVLGPTGDTGYGSLGPVSDRMEPMRLALAGETGSALAHDHRDREVLAAYTPVGATGLGLVLKVDQDEVCRPILEAVVVAGITAVIAIAGGAGLLMWLGSPLVRRARQEEGKYRTLFESDHDGMLLLAGPEGTIVEANRTWWRLLGLDRDEVIAGRRVAEFLSPVLPGAPGRQEEVEELLRRVVVAGPQHIPDRVRHRSGRDIVVMIDIRRVFIDRSSQFVFTVRDISDLTSAEQAVRDSEKNLALILDSIGDAVIALDTEGRVQRMNPIAEQLCGWTQAQAKGHLLDEVMRFTPKNHSGRWPADPVSTVVRERRVISFGNHAEVVSRSGRRCTVLVSASPIIDDRNESIGAVVVVRDISKQRRLEDQLRQAQKMEAIGLLAGGIAHDFNNLLTGVVGYANMLRKLVPEDGREREYVEVIRDSGMQATQLAHQLLAFGRKQNLQPTALDVNDVVDEVIGMLKRVLPVSIDIVLDLAEDLDRVKLDRVQIHQVLMNLAINARDAMPDGGALIIRTRGVEVTGSFTRTHVDMATGRYVVIEVFDTGHGIEPEHLDHIFEPFYTTKTPDHGSGLGLAMVHGIVTQSGGHIEVESVPGSGCEFHLYFPALIPAADEHEVEDLRTPLRLGTGQRVLVVDDNAVIRDFAARVLAEAGYQVLVASSPDMALSMIRRPDQGIDILLTDCVLPGVPGTDLARHIQLLRPEVEVIYMSGYAEDVPMECATDPNCFLRKPFTDDVLVETVANAVERQVRRSRL